jgi:NTE family protein
VLASACLPQMYKAVEIGGEAYWDGGFSANPALFPLIASSASPDVLIVQINPFHRKALPRTARDIINRVNEISFNTSLVKELRTLALVRRAGVLAPELEAAGADRLFLHLVHVDEEVQDLAASSKLNAEWGYLQELFDRGRRWADLWLRDNFDSIGKASTFDVEQLFEGPAARPAELPPALET